VSEKKELNPVGERIRAQWRDRLDRAPIIHQPHHETRDRLIIARDAGGGDMSILTPFSMEIDSR
jgi:hypothetical protein